MRRKIVIILSIICVIATIVVGIVVGSLYGNESESIIVNGDEFRIQFEEGYANSGWAIYVNNSDNRCGRIEPTEGVGKSEFINMIFESVRLLYSNENVRIYVFEQMTDVDFSEQPVIYTIDDKNFYFLNREDDLNPFIKQDEWYTIKERHEILYKEYPEQELYKWMNWGLVETDKYKEKFQVVESSFKRMNEFLLKWKNKKDEFRKTIDQNGVSIVEFVREGNRIVGLKNCTMRISKQSIKDLNAIDKKFKSCLGYVLMYRTDGIAYVSVDETEVFRYKTNGNTPKFFIEESRREYSMFNTYKLGGSWYYQMII